jgi:hypothetical protein
MRWEQANIAAARYLRRNRWRLRWQIEKARKHELERCWRVGFGKPANISDYKR